MRKSDAKRYGKLLSELRLSTKKHLYDEEQKAFINRYDDMQYSAASQIWMILGGVIDGKQASELLNRCSHAYGCIQPATPYLNHYYVEALIKCAELENAKEFIKNYWGRMMTSGRDTFGEVARIGDDYLSPYGNCVINSACHAWSCTPSYFIRRYFL